MTDFNITPPPELVASLRNSAPYGIRDAGVTRELHLITASYCAGADYELQECEKFILSTIPAGAGSRAIADALRATRRPEPPISREQALEDFDGLMSELDGAGQYSNCAERIRRALKALPNV